MQQIRHFTDLEVWRKSHTLFLVVMKCVEGFPRQKSADVIAHQILRSCGSIGANIAEGFNRTKKQFLNYLEIAKGSCYETENWMYKACDGGFLQKDKCKRYYPFGHRDKQDAVRFE